MPDAVSSSTFDTGDLTLARARIAWGGPDRERIWDRFTPDWRDRLRAAWASELTRGTDPASALELLRQEQAAEARFDPARVHPSWWVRALQDESPAVRRLVAARAPEPIGEAVRSALELGPDALQTDHPPHPDALQWVLSLWSERLIGGPDTSRDDPSVIEAISQLSSRSLSRLIAATGLAKWAYALQGNTAAIEVEPPSGLSPHQEERLEHFRRHWTTLDLRAVRVARDDHQGIGQHTAADLRRLGLITFARLMTTAEPRRIRWALQHLPYPAARFLRSRMSLKNPHLFGRELVAWEERIFRAARKRLLWEESLDRPDSGTPEVITT